MALRLVSQEKLWVLWQLNFWTPVLLTLDGLHLSQSGKRALAQKLAGLIGRALHWLGREKRKIPGSPVIISGTVCQNLRKWTLMGYLDLLHEVLATKYNTWNVSLSIHEEQTRGAQSFDSVPQIWYHWLKWNLVGSVLRLECPVGQLQALQEMHTEQKRQGGGITCNGRAGMYQAYSWQWCSWEPLGRKQGTNNVDVIVGVCYTPPSQDDEVDGLCFEELRDASKSTALALMGDFNLPESNWKHHTTGTAWDRRFLKTWTTLWKRSYGSQLKKMPSWICCLSTERISWAKWKLRPSWPQQSWSHWV